MDGNWLARVSHQAGLKSLSCSMSVTVNCIMKIIKMTMMMFMRVALNRHEKPTKLVWNQVFCFFIALLVAQLYSGNNLFWQKAQRRVGYYAVGLDHHHHQHCHFYHHHHPVVVIIIIIMLIHYHSSSPLVMIIVIFIYRPSVERQLLRGRPSFCPSTDSYHFRHLHHHHHHDQYHHHNY